MLLWVLGVGSEGETFVVVWARNSGFGSFGCALGVCSGFVLLEGNVDVME